LQRVIVTSVNRVATGTTLGEALNAIFGRGQPAAAAGGAAGTSGAAAPAAAAAAAGPRGSVPALLQQAQDHYDRALAAQRAGNWAEYGKQIDALGATLQQLRSRQRWP